MRPKTRIAILLSSVVLACVASAVLSVFRLVSDRVLAVSLLAFTATITVLLCRAIKHHATLRELNPVPLHQAQVKREIFLSKVGIIFFMAVLVAAWIQGFRGAPIVALLAGSLFSVLIIVGLLVHIKKLQQRF